MSKEIMESKMTFSFPDSVKVVKFDDTEYYRKNFNYLPGGKGVDIIADSQERIQLIEIKNCLGYERDNLWRTGINNRDLQKAPEGLNVDDRDSFDIETAKKVAMTIACVYGAWSKQISNSKLAEDLSFIWEGLSNDKILSHQKELMVILVLEGNFPVKTRSKRVIMDLIQESIKKKLKWLQCKVCVVNSDSYKERYFTIKK